VKKRWKNFFVAAFIVAFLVLFAAFHASKPRILVLHSFGEDTEWVSRVDRGIDGVLSTNRRPLVLETHFLGLDQAAARLHPEAAAALARRTIDRIKPDVLIAVDDDANALVSRQYQGTSLPRIIYVSINRKPADYGYENKPNVSGITETLPLEGLRELAGNLSQSRPLRIAAIGIDDETGRAEADQVRRFDWSPHTLAAATLVTDAAAWRGFIARNDTDILLVLGTRELPSSSADPSRVSASELVSWTEDNSRAFPVGIQIDYTRDGGGIALCPPPDVFGQKAMKLALDWLDDRTTPGAPSPVDSSHFDVALRPDSLKKRGVSLPSIYSEAARANATLYR